MSPGIKERLARSGCVYQTIEGIACDKENEDPLNDAGGSEGKAGQAAEMVIGAEWMMVGIGMKIWMMKKGKPWAHHHSEDEMSSQKPEKKENHSGFISSLG